jgi:serine/threonine protein kinase
MSFSLGLARQMIERIQLVHEKGYVHRDLRP